MEHDCPHGRGCLSSRTFPSRSDKGDDHKALLRNISIAAPEGTFISVIGASGCGKSTFILKTLAGIQCRSPRAAILLAGHPVETLRQQLPLAVGYLPQFGAFHGDLTVAEILDFRRGFAPALLGSARHARTMERACDRSRPHSSFFASALPDPFRAVRCAASPWQRNSLAIRPFSFSTN